MNKGGPGGNRTRGSTTRVVNPHATLPLSHAVLCTCTGHAPISSTRALRRAFARTLRATFPRTAAAPHQPFDCARPYHTKTRATSRPLHFPDGPVGAPQREGRGSLGRTFREPRMRKNIARGGRERGIRPSHAKLATHELASYRDRRTRLGSARTRSCGGTCRGSRTQPPSGSLEADSSRGEIAIEDRV